jgi:hypothetical protein
MSPMRRLSVVVSVDPECWAEALPSLRSAGLEVDSEMEAVGVVSGTVDEDHLRGLDAVTGVEAVEESRTVQLPPPSSPLQ